MAGLGLQKRRLFRHRRLVARRAGAMTLGDHFDLPVPKGYADGCGVLAVPLAAFAYVDLTETGEDELAWSPEMAWAHPRFPRNQVDRAGASLASDNTTVREIMHAYEIINNWRASRAFPLNNFQTNLRAKIKNIQSDVLVAQRIKRLESIKAKLLRPETKTLELSQMQDIGGCRAVLKNIENLYKAVASFHKSKFAHVLRSERDYISSPKADGYRGYHLIYQYKSLANQIAAYDNLRIEIQLRTALQHEWATAVEAVGAFTREALKSNQGSQDWLRLFALTSAYIAVIEETARVPNMPTSERQLASEIRDVAEKLYAVETLAAYRVTLDYVGKLKEKASKYFLVHYHYGEHRVSVEGYAANASQTANLDYTKAESNKKEGDNIVLVSVDSLKALMRAYPNYFLDTAQFTELLREIITEAGVDEREEDEALAADEAMKE